MHWITHDTDHLGGAPRVRETRISVSFLLELIASGITIKEMTEEYPSLTEVAIKGVLLELSDQEKKVA